MRDLATPATRPGGAGGQLGQPLGDDLAGAEAGCVDAPGGQAADQQSNALQLVGQLSTPQLVAGQQEEHDARPTDHRRHASITNHRSPTGTVAGPSSSSGCPPMVMGRSRKTSLKKAVIMFRCKPGALPAPRSKPAAIVWTRVSDRLNRNHGKDGPRAIRARPAGTLFTGRPWSENHMPPVQAGR